MTIHCRGLKENLCKARKRIATNACMHADAKSGIENVTLSYTTDNGTSWINIPMDYNTTTGLYEVTIPEQPIETLVKYEITAFDKANNKSVQNNSGQYFIYIVIPEFSTTMTLVLFIIVSLSAACLTRKVNCKEKQRQR